MTAQLLAGDTGLTRVKVARLRLIDDSMFVVILIFKNDSMGCLHVFWAGEKLHN